MVAKNIEGFTLVVLLKDRSCRDRAPKNVNPPI